ncbi:MAG: glycosyltransferase family 4 protein [Candidatus Omnitrophica bacterium]|nr:glycosyltransferase family 4 protein [Candidatus Omnitrophota bacterium]
MKIFIYYTITNNPFGGANSFFRTLIEFFRKNNIEIAAHINDEYDIMLINSGSRGQDGPINISDIKNVKRFGSTSFWDMALKRKKPKKIISRLDGIRALYAQQNELTSMDLLQLKAAQLADHIIYQSVYSIESFRRFQFQTNQCTVIANGVNPSLFNTVDKIFWDGQRKLQCLAASWSNNPLKGHQTIAAFSENSEIDVKFIGRWPQSVDKKNVNCVSAKTQDELALALKKADFFLHPSEGDNCPNVVLEALSCGLPVIYHESGGTGEIAQPYGVALSKRIDKQAIEQTLQILKKDYEIFKARIIDHQTMFSIETAGKKYLEVFNRICSNK